MKTVSIDKNELLIRLKENKKTHEETYNEAMQEYRKEAIQIYKEALKKAENGAEILRHIDIEKPVHHIKDYNRIIQMLEMSVEEVIQLTQDEFAQYVMDEWHWKHDFLNNTVSYIGKIK